MPSYDGLYISLGRNQGMVTHHFPQVMNRDTGGLIKFINTKKATGELSIN